jgi:hypothetical protein
VAVTDLNTEIANGAFDLCESEQELDGTQISSAPVNQHRLDATQGVRPELGRVKPDTGHPVLHKSSILTGGKAARAVASTAEQDLTRLASS